jgi:citrate synthase
MPETAAIIDNRTGKKYDLSITENANKAADLRQMKVGERDLGLMTYGPALMNPVLSRSRVTYIDGDRGILHYRGYPIDQLAEQSTLCLSVGAGSTGVKAYLWLQRTIF